MKEKMIIKIFLYLALVLASIAMIILGLQMTKRKDIKDYLELYNSLWD